MAQRTRTPASAAVDARRRRPLLATAALAGCFLVAALCTLGSFEAADVAESFNPTDQGLAFVGATAPKVAAHPREESLVIVGSRKLGTIPGRRQEYEMSRQKRPRVDNLKDQYFIIFIRSQKVKQWYPINIISGSDAAKALKGLKENQVTNALGGGRLADYQILRAVGMSVYQQKDEVMKQSVTMHPQLKHAKEVSFGFKEISDNEQFNEDPRPSLQLTNITIIPPESELRNLLDDAGEALQKTGEKVSQIGDNVKGFFGNR